MSRDPIETVDKFLVVRRRVMAFSVLGIFTLLIFLGMTRPAGLGTTGEPPPDGVAWVAQAVDSASITWRHTPALFLAGLAAGLLSGMLGMGGGVLKISFMLLVLRFDIYFARAVSLATMFFSCSSALISIWKKHLLVWKIALPMAMFAVPAAAVMAVVGNNVHEGTLAYMFAIFVILLAVGTAALAVADPNEELMSHVFEDKPQEKEAVACGTIGALHGTACGLLGISGGVVSTPLQQFVLHMPLRHAIANTLFVSTLVTLVAGVAVLWSGVNAGHYTFSKVMFVDVFMGTGAALGAPLGAKIGERCNVSLLRGLFVVLTFGAGMSILLRG